MTITTPPPIDLDRLFKLRLVVARFGEMDLARWWNSKGMLGHHGAVVLKRGFPSTHYFAQARVVFAVARSRSREVFDLAGAVTLWDMPAELEDAFEDRWHTWLDEGEAWAPLFESLQTLSGGDLLEALSSQGLIGAAERETVGKLRRSAEGRAVPVGSARALDDELVTLLAAAFARGEPGSPAIPYARVEE